MRIKNSDEFFELVYMVATDKGSFTQRVFTGEYSEEKLKDMLENLTESIKIGLDKKTAQSYMYMLQCAVSAFAIVAKLEGLEEKKE